MPPPDARFWLKAAPDDDTKGLHYGTDPDDDDGPDNVNGIVWPLRYVSPLLPVFG